MPRIRSAGTNTKLDPRPVRRRLLAWFENNKRNLPWRRTRDPYRIWISEIMLQQTRVAAVIPYYERFLLRFPDLAALAAAPEDELLTAWAGLGYYSRARNLRNAANQILELGAFPRDYSSIRNLAGIGEYTAAAIASIAFDLPHAAMDGNVVRVLSRLTSERGNVRSTVVRRRLRQVSDLLLDHRNPGDFNQALMELGATVCLPRQPQCQLCPLGEHCRARHEGIARELPLDSRREKPNNVHKQLVVIENRGKVLLWQRAAGSRRLAGFWELPEFEQLAAARLDGLVGHFRHTIVNTKYIFEVHRGFIGRIPKGFRWVDRTKISEIPLSTATKKALKCLERPKQ